MEPHIPLARRKGLAGRMLYFESTSRERLPLLQESQLQASQLDDLQDRLYKMCNQGKDSPNTTRLDEFIHRLPNRLRKFCEDMEPSATPAIQDVITKLETLTRKVDCTICGSAVCAGTEHDDYILGSALPAGRGDCMRPLYNIFVLALSAAVEYYKTHSTLLPSNAAASVRFSSGFLNERPESALPYSIGGATFFEPPTSLVQLQVCIEDLDLSSYSAVPYVLFHECICHAFQGLLSSSGTNRETIPSDLFAEGWMDWIASEIANEVLTGNSPLLKPGAIPPESAKTAASYHLKRGDYEAKVRPKYVLQYAFGRQIAEDLLSFFGRLGQLPTTPRELLWRLSFDINLIREKRHDLNQFVRNLGKHLPAPNRMNYELVRPLVSLFRDYCDRSQVHPDQELTESILNRILALE